MAERYDEFGTLLRQLMLAHDNMTGAELGRQLGGLNKSSVHHWKEGNQRPEPKTVVAIADLFGYDRLELLKLARWLPGEPQPQPDPKRQAQHKTLDEWLTAVGTEHEDAFWDALKAEAKTTRALIDRLRTAVNLNPDTAVKTVLSDPIAPPRKQRKRRVSPLSVRLHHSLAA